jgi:hypothetical protein
VAETRASKTKEVIMPDKQAAIDVDEVAERPLSEVSGADLLSALSISGGGISSLMVWPEKKKVELWVEPENFGKVRVVDIIRVIRVEKKKRELELPWFNRFDPEPWANQIEPHPHPSYASLVEDVARVVESRMRGVGRG